MVGTLQSNSISSFHFQLLSRATLTMSSCNLTGAAMAACVFPGDIMIEILSRLPVKSLLRFRCVCKSWCSLITNPSFITKHITQTTHNKNENLIIHSGGYKKSKYVISMLLHGDKTLDRSINLKLPFPTISNYVKIVGSCNGLLCLTLSRVGTEIFLWNPATREHRNLPEPGIAIPQGKRFHSVVLGFGFNANTSDYKLVRLFWYKGLNSHKPLFQKTEVYSKKRDSWREIKVILECRLSESSPTAVLGGGVHWMASGSDCSEVIACFDMGREVFGEIQLPDSFGFGTEIGKQLAVVKDLLAVIVHPLHREMNKCIDVWVMKEYAVKESWTKQLRIGPFSGVERPITCFRNGKFVLQNNKDKLFLYDSKTREFDNLPVRKARYIYDIHTCMETLVSVKEGE